MPDNVRNVIEIRFDYGFLFFNFVIDGDSDGMTSVEAVYFVLTAVFTAVFIVWTEQKLRITDPVTPIAQPGQCLWQSCG